MLWMETYLFYCSVRLGVIVVASISFITLFIPAVLFLVMGISIFDRLVELLHNDEYYKKQFMVMKLLNWIENHSDNFMILMDVYLFVHMASALLAIVGGLRLQKWLLVPFSVMELVRVIYSLISHIIMMIVLKKVLNLGLLIAVTLAGGFIILYLGYNWTATVALFQIISLIHTERYKALYGDDPLHPLRPFYTGSGGVIDNVRVLITPNSNDIDDLKRKPTNMPAPVISVLPSNFTRNNINAGENEGKIPMLAARRPRARWPEQQAALQATNELQQRQTFNPYAKQNTQYTNAVDYNYWQWSELGGGGSKRHSHLISSNNQWH